MKSFLLRALAFLVLWLAVVGREIWDLPVGVGVAAAAAWASVRLSPPSKGRVNLYAALVFFLDFLRLSFVSGLDVAVRALSPTPRLRPGVVEARLRLRPGYARSVFCLIASLLPGTLLTGFDPNDGQKVYVHGLDLDQAIAADLTAEETAFMQVIDRE